MMRVVKVDELQGAGGGEEEQEKEQSCGGMTGSARGYTR